MSERLNEQPDNGVLSEADDDKPPGLFERLKSSFGFSDDQTFRGQLERLLRWNRDADESLSVPEQTMLRNVLRFGALRVEDVMVPRADIIAIDEQATVAELLRLLETAGHSRLPLYRDALDEPVGMVHVKDVIGWVMAQAATEENGDDHPSAAPGNGAGNGAVADFVESASINLKGVDLTQSLASIKIKRQVLFVPPSMPVADLLLRMQSTHVHLALVVDEYGGTDGLVSIEDLVEEIVGEIEDEHDVNDGPMLKPAGREGYIADARTPIEDLQERLNVDLGLTSKDEDEVDTLGGLVFSITGRVPVRGELIPHPSGLEFEVLDADPRRIKRLKIHLQKLIPGETAAH